MRIRSLFVVAFISALTGYSSAAQTASSCDTPLVRIMAPSAALEERVCRVIQRAQPLLANCGLTVNDPLEVQIMDDPKPSGLMGYYSMSHGRIMVQSPRNLSEMLPPDSAYQYVPNIEYFDSIVVHELAHALFLSTPCGQETCLAGHEYLAYALQLQSMSSVARNSILNALPAEEPIDLTWFTDSRLRETPEVFAANAWRHFSQDGYGCNFISRIVSGEAVFPSEFE